LHLDRQRSFANKKDSHSLIKKDCLRCTLNSHPRQFFCLVLLRVLADFGHVLRSFSRSHDREDRGKCQKNERNNSRGEIKSRMTHLALYRDAVSEKSGNKRNDSDSYLADNMNNKRKDAEHLRLNTHDLADQNNSKDERKQCNKACKKRGDHARNGFFIVIHNFAVNLFL